MNEKTISKYSFAAQVMTIFAFSVLFITIAGKLVGSEAAAYSSIYQLGDKGIATSTIWQFLLCSFMITCIKTFIFSGRFLENWMIVWKTILMLAAILLVILVFIVCFKWFPLDYWQGWAGFLISFGGCFAASTILMIVKTKSEEKKYGELLAQYKKKRKKE